MHTSEQLPKAAWGRACMWGLLCAQRPWGPSREALTLPDFPVLFPSFITFRSCAYLDKKHTIFGR